MTQEQLEHRKVNEDELFFCPDAERQESQAIGICFGSETNARQIVSALCEDDFLISMNREVFKLIRERVVNGKAIDVAELAEGLSRDDAQKIASYFTPGISTPSVIIEKLKKTTANRHGFMLGRRLLNACQLSRQNPSTILSTLRETADSIEKMGHTSAFEYADEAYEKAKKFFDDLKHNKDGALGYSCGIAGTSQYIRFKPQTFVVIASRPSLGKSALVLNMINYLSLMQGIKTGLVSLEDTTDQLMARIMSINTGIPWNMFFGDMPMEMKERIDAFESEIVKNRENFVVDDPSSASISQLVSMIYEMVDRHKVKVVFVDYLQLLKMDINTTGSADNMERLTIAEASMTLKRIARELNICVCATAQLNRAHDEIPRMEHLKGSGQIEQDADIIALLDRERVPEAGAVACKGCIYVPKHRNGPVGSVPVLYYGESFRWEGDLGL